MRNKANVPVDVRAARGESRAKMEAAGHAS